MLSLIEPDDEILDIHRRRWAYFAEAAFSKGYYDKESERKSQIDYFGFVTKRTIPAFGYYNMILLAPTDKVSYISDTADQAVVDYCMNNAEQIYYVYNGWMRYKDRYNDWILKQRNEEGFWELPRKPNRYDFPLSDSWRSRKNRIIDSTIMVLRFLNHNRALYWNVLRVYSLFRSASPDVIGHA